MRIFIILVMAQCLVVSAAANPPGSPNREQNTQDANCSDYQRSVGWCSQTTKGGSKVSSNDYYYNNNNSHTSHNNDSHHHVPNHAVCLVSARDCFCR
jgi:hypothetical protein